MEVSLSSAIISDHVVHFPFFFWHFPNVIVSPRQGGNVVTSPHQSALGPDPSTLESLAVA